MQEFCSTRQLLNTALTCGLLATGWMVGRGLRRRITTRALPANAAAARPSSMSPALAPAGGSVSSTSRHQTKKRLYETAATLSLSVLADSLMEHYHGCFFRPAMYIAPTVSALALAESLSASAAPATYDPTRCALYGATFLSGIAGFGFHFYNIGKREGGFSWLNFFYGSPLGAPGALGMAGLFGLAAELIDPQAPHPRILGLPAGQTVAGLVVFGLIGTVGEVWLLHFRGAFHDPFMYVPVTIPVITCAALAAAAARPEPRHLRRAAGWLKATGIVGLAGSAFHAYGIQRNMGGWRNLSQMAFQGPPLPAPPGFTGLSLAGLGALKLLDGALSASQRSPAGP